MTGNGTVQIAYLHNEHVSHSFMESLRGVLEYDLDHGRRIARKHLNLRCGSGLVAHTRNYGARLFLDKTEHEWLLYIDTDMGFEANAVHRLLAAADPDEKPLIGALCFAYMEAAYDGMGGWRRKIVPTMYKIGNVIETGKPAFCHYDGPYPEDEVVPVAATGGAFLLIHRTVLEKLRAEHGDHWFDQLYDQDGDIVGEDIGFCARAGQAGVSLHVHTGVKTTHHKEIWVAEEDYFIQEAVAVTVMPPIPVHVDIAASFAALAAYEHDHDNMLKFTQDLDRYREIIKATGPQVVVETGTRTGGSAKWFADLGVNVITVDVNAVHVPVDYRGPWRGGPHGQITQVVGSSTDPAVVAQVVELVAGRRCMVSLDSDHSGPHVTAEIDAYGPMVTPGCYLVVEDGIFGYGEDAKVQQGLAGLDGSPMDAILARLVDNPDWSRDVAIERMHPVSHNPAGYWIRND